MFAWKPIDMVGVDKNVIEHKLNIKPRSKEIKHKNSDNEETRIRQSTWKWKLAKVGILKEAIFPTWIANHVMVKKHDGTWRMCVDYSDLNQVCPEDFYPYQR